MCEYMHACVYTFICSLFNSSFVDCFLSCFLFQEVAEENLHSCHLFLLLGVRYVPFNSKVVRCRSHSGVEGKEHAQKPH